MAPLGKGGPHLFPVEERSVGCSVLITVTKNYSSCLFAGVTYKFPLLLTHLQPSGILVMLGTQASNLLIVPN